MTVPSPRPLDDASDQASDFIHEQLHQIRQLAQANLDRPAFLQEWLGRVVAALAAAGGFVWMVDDFLQPLASENGEELLPLLVNGSRVVDQHARMLQQSLHHGEPRLVAIGEGDPSDPGAMASSGYLLIHCPITADGRPVALAEIVQRSATSLAAQEGFLRFVKVATELASWYWGRSQGNTHQLSAKSATRVGLPTSPDRVADASVQEFLYQLHAHLELDATAFAIANDGRVQFGCDRVSVAIVRGTECRLLAVSGVDALDRRANLVRASERLASAVARINESLWYDETDQERPPQLANPLDEFLDESAARVIGVVPLCARHGEIVPPPVGVLIVECFHRQDPATLSGKVAQVNTQCALALQNAAQYERLRRFRFLASFVPGGETIGGRRKLLIVGGLLLAVAALLLFVQVEHTVTARGELQPLHRRDIFAPSDGTIEQVLVAHEDRIEAGQPLVVLRDSALELEHRRVVGAIETARKKLTSVQAIRLDLRDASRSAERDRAGRISSEEEELKQELQSLQEQLNIVERRQAELTVRSPLDGRVVTWDVDELLNARPVRRGQVLMTVARLDGPWELLLRIPEDQAGHVLMARRERQLNLDVTYILANHPEDTLTETLNDVALATETDETLGSYVPAQVILSADRVPRSRPGTTVSAQIACGQKPLGYVWFHDLYRAIVARVWY